MSSITKQIIRKRIEQKPNVKNIVFDKTLSKESLIHLLDFIFHCYAYSPNFNNTQHLLAIISGIDDDYDLKGQHPDILQKIINRYSFVFRKELPNDIVNLLLMCAEYDIEIPYQDEMEFKKHIDECSDPILWATFLVYSRYNKKFFNTTLDEVENLLDGKIQAIIDHKMALMYPEFWWIIIFNKSPYIKPAIQSKIDCFLDDVLRSHKSPVNQQSFSQLSPQVQILDLLIEFMKTNDKQFFSWDVDKKTILRHLTYRTLERTLFMNKNKSSFEGDSLVVF